jgi:thymidylate synthase
MDRSFCNFDDVFVGILAQLMERPDFICKPRGQEIRETLAATFELRDPRRRLIYNPKREPNYGFAAGEFLWYWQGRQDLEMMTYYNKRMKDFSNDGKTLNSAYGWRLCANVVGFDRRPPHVGRSAPPLTQWDVAKMTLDQDPDSRRAVLLINEPADEVTAVTVGSKDVPCTLSLQFFIRDRKLHLHVHMRSNDVVWGLTNDLFSFTLFQECMLLDLKRSFPQFHDLQLGSYFHTAGSLHLYERHYGMAKQCIDHSTEYVGTRHPMPALSSLDQLENLCLEEDNLRKRYVSQIKLDNYAPNSGERWLAEQLNQHRLKRDAEESSIGERK